jgi:hypothetical protein
MYHFKKSYGLSKNKDRFSSYTYVIFILPNDIYINHILSQQSSYRQPALTLKISLGFASTVYLYWLTPSGTSQCTSMFCMIQ